MWWPYRQDAVLAMCMITWQKMAGSVEGKEETAAADEHLFGLLEMVHHNLLNILDMILLMYKIIRLAASHLMIIPVCTVLTYTQILRHSRHE